jgi:hypothetical protein
LVTVARPGVSQELEAIVAIANGNRPSGQIGAGWLN